MTSPAMPAQPKKPFDQTGGYMGPMQRTQRTERTPRSDGTLPGAPTPPGSLPAPSPGASPSAQPTGGPTAPTAAPGGAGLPDAAQNLGLDEQGYQEVLEDAKNSTDPDEFKTQFTQLMEQREMIAPRTDGGGMPTEDYGKFLAKGLREAIAFGTTPAEFGGKGYTEGQAKMMAIVEARRRYPDISPTFWTQHINARGTGGQVSPEDLGVTSVGTQGKKTTVQVSPTRAAKLDPTKISDILTSPNLKTALEWAREYKERVGPGANAADFVQDVFDGQVSKMQAGGTKLQADLKKAQAELANAEAMKAQAEAAGDQALVGEADAALLQAKSVKETAEAALLNAKVPDASGAMQNAVTFIEDNQDVLSVAAALAQVY